MEKITNKYVGTFSCDVVVLAQVGKCKTHNVYKLIQYLASKNV